MTLVEPAKPRALINDTGSGLQIVIPAKRNWGQSGFLGFWLAAWTVGGGFAWFTLFHKKTPIPGRVFLAVWLCGWLFGELAAIYTVSPS